MSITRRTALAGMACIPAGAALVQPSSAEPPPHPWERAQELASELADALSEGDGAFGGPGGKWSASVEPSNTRERPVCFHNISARRHQQTHVSSKLQKLIDEHKAAREAFGNACDGIDRVLLKRDPSKASLRRYKRASKAEGTALLAVCSHVSYGYADACAKAKYLLPLRDEFQEEHVIALIKSGIRP